MRYKVWVVCLVAVTLLSISSVGEENKLSPAEKELLLGLIGSPLTDPGGKRYCTVKVMARPGSLFEGEIEVTGWYQSGTDGKPARVFFTDGDSMPVISIVNDCDFVEETKSRFSGGKKIDSSDLADAAWLAHFGQEELAAKIIAELKRDTSRWIYEPEKESPDERIVRRLKEGLAWSTFYSAVSSFEGRHDEEALWHARHFHKTYPEFAKQFGNFSELLVDLERREKAKALNQPELEKPFGFDEWETAKKVTWLIEQLDQVDAKQVMQPGSVPLFSDWRVVALIEIGDPAVKPLIDCIEKDQRMTRSVHFWRAFHRSRTVLGVREAALEAVEGIVQFQTFHTISTGDNFTVRGEKEAQSTASRLREYWNKYGKMPFDERMMYVLRDSASQPEAMRRAAENLVNIDGEFIWGRRINFKRSGDNAPENPVVKKFKDPTAAEAMLTAMDRDLADHDQKWSMDRYWDPKRREIELIYLDAVADLGDKRILPAISERCVNADTVQMRLQTAEVGHRLGASKLLDEFARNFRDGKVEFPANDASDRSLRDQLPTAELAGVVRTLGRAKTKAANEALNALADPTHPAHAIAARAIHEFDPGWYEDNAWFIHPYCVRILRLELDDETLTGRVALVDGDQYVEKFKDGSSSTSIPELISDPATRRDRVELRHCDRVAEKLAALIVNLPPYHPLLKKADERLKKVRAILDQGFVREATPAERERYEERNSHRSPKFFVEKSL